HPNAPSLSTLPPRERPRYLLVRTYARDSINATAKEPEQADFLNENTDLCELFANPHQRCFFENDLPKLHAKGGYRNSHLPTQPFDEWPLPYRSAIVWPIRRLGVESQLHPEHELLGFLCVDSASTRVFVHRYDFEIGALIADALYMYMKANLDGHSTQGGLKHGA